jgi:RNA polymerase sigma-B factor
VTRVLPDVPSRSDERPEHRADNPDNVAGRSAAIRYPGPGGNHGPSGDPEPGGDHGPSGGPAVGANPRFREDPPASGSNADIVVAYLPLARAIANRYRHRGLEFDDLEQVARLGLIKAVERWQPERGHFVGYAIPTIDGELKRYFRDSGATIRIPRVLYETQPKVTAAQRALRHRMSREPSTGEIAAEAGIPEQRVRSVQTASTACQPLSTDDEDHGMGNIAEMEAPDEIAPVASRTDLRIALRGLPPREQRIIALRFVWGQSQLEIARTFGVSQMQISRILRHALDGLRDQMGDDHAA